MKSLWTDKEITNDYGRTAIKELFGAALMDFPKSPDLLARLVRIGSRSDDTILDFFAGSSTTAHAVLDVNSADGSNRRFIMVQLDEKTAVKCLKLLDCLNFSSSSLSAPNFSSLEFVRIECQ